jgi:hypothetical protein
MLKIEFVKTTVQYDPYYQQQMPALLMIFCNDDDDYDLIQQPDSTP